MSPLAHILVQQGHTVTGSDINTSAVIEYLKSEGVQTTIGHRASNITSPDVVVYSSAIPPNNPELLTAQDTHIPIIPRSRLLADVMAIKHGIVVAGSHGKTSTTGLIFWGLQHLHQRPSLVFGGKFQHEKSSARLGNGNFIVVESDESDRSFLMLRPTIAVVTNIDHEHVQAYGSLDKLQESFQDFASQIPFYGFSVLSVDCPHSREVFSQLNHKKISFGLSKDADIHIAAIQPDCVSLQESDGTLTDVGFRHPGEHCTQNLAAAFATLRGLGFQAKDLQNAFITFPGIYRRLEKISGAAKVHVWDDYAHHPTEMRAVIQTMQKLKPQEHPLWLVFQPHRYSRFLEHRHEFLKVIQECDHVVLMPIYTASESKPAEFDATWREFIHKAKQHHIPITEIQGTNPLSDTFLFLHQHLPTHSTVLCCGAGDITLLAHHLGQAVQKLEFKPHEFQHNYS